MFHPCELPRRTNYHDRHPSQSRDPSGRLWRSRRLQSRGHQFIGATTFEALTGRPVYSHAFEAKEHFQGEHIGLARRAELTVIAPATAQTIARLAHGMADDLLSTTVLVTTAPVIVAPAMNCDMWAKPAVQRNVKLLVDDGCVLVGPEEGWLSCGQTGSGRMADPGNILAVIESTLRVGRVVN